MRNVALLIIAYELQLTNCNCNCCGPGLVRDSFSGASRLAQVAALALLGDTDRARCCLRRGAVALKGRAKAGREALLAAGVPEAALAGSQPGAGPLDLIDFGAVSAETIDEALLWQTAMDLGVVRSTNHTGAAIYCPRFICSALLTADQRCR